MSSLFRFIVLLIMFLFVFAGISYSATYYVDQNHGSASDSNAGTSESAPWLTLKKATNTAIAGDTVIVKAGTYIDTAASATHPYPAFNTNDGSSGNYITFRSEPALAAKVQAYQWNPTTSTGYMAWGLEYADYVVIDGFSIQGGFRANTSTHITIKNCELTGGFHPPSDPSLLWGIAFEQTSSGLIQNNYVHNMLTSGNSSHNTAAVMLFGNCDNNIIEYNSVEGDSQEIYSAYGVKGGGTDDNTWRYNFGDGFISGFFGIGSTSETIPMYRSIIHHNIIINTTMFIDMDNNTFNFKIYNNTAYNLNRFIRAIDDNNNNLELWNNLTDTISTDFIRWNTYDAPSAVPSDLLDYSDYNSSDATNWYTREASTVSYTLAQWVTNTTFGDYSNTTSPGFLSTGGTTPEDYKRSSYPTDGRGGAYDSVMGAYVTGSETIGYHSNVTVVYPPQNVRND